MTWGVHTTLVPSYFDPAETLAGTPFMVLYGLHDALVKPMPGKTVAPSLAESWTVSPDGLVYEFVLRKGAKFHTGEAVTADDVKFSFERYRGVFAKTLKDRVAAVETPDPGHVRFRLRQPWPDFMTYYGPDDRRGVDRAEEVREKVGERLQTAPLRPPYPSSRSSRESSWCWRPSPATGARPRRSSAWCCA